MRPPDQHDLDPGAMSSIVHDIFNAIRFIPVATTIEERCGAQPFLFRALPIARSGVVMRQDVDA